MKKTQKIRAYFSSPFVLITLFCVVLPSTLLYWRYWQLQKTVHRLVELKDDYRSYAMTLKRMIRDQAQDTATEDSKKKTVLVDSDEEDSVFNLINRDPEYLKTSALAFAKEHNLEKQLSALFDSQCWDELPPIKLFPVKKRRLAKKTTISGISAKARFLSTKERQKKTDFSCSWPVAQDRFWISSPFGPRKMGKKKWKFHYGVDLAALKGTTVRAASGGVVIQSCWYKGYGNCITIAHNRKYRTRYAHLNTRKVSVGQKVKKGTIIGTVGDTGFVRKVGKDASHLHFEVYAFGKPINPILVLS